MTADPSTTAEPSTAAGLAAEPPDAGSGTPPGADPTDGSPPGPPARRRNHWWRETAIVVVVALLAAFLLRTFVVQTFFIPSGSMEPTLHIGDRILVNKLSYDLHGVGRGDIVVFRRPADENCGGTPVADLVKRVIALPGETISLSSHPAGYVVINGKRLSEPYLASYEQGTSMPGPAGTAYNLSKPFTVPQGEYFVMGDNRTDSCDSRYWGPIPKSLIVGKVELRIWPLSSFHIF